MTDQAATSTPGGTTATTVLPPRVSVRGVRASYGRIEVLHGVDLEVPAGSVFALLGPNGAGKSTLLKVMSGRMRPSAGEVVIDDTPIGRTSAEKLARQGVCAVPEGRGIFYGVTFAPYQLADGGAARWDEYKEQAADHSLAYYRRFISCFCA